MYSQVVTGFAHNAALSFGMGSPDISTLELIAEECFVYSVRGADNCIDETMFSLSVVPDPEGVLVECRYTGMPLQLRKSFAVIHSQLHEDSDIDDISIFLLKSLTDDIQFINQEKDGWMIRILKRCETHLPLHTATKNELVVSEELEIRYATPSDAQDIAELTFHTYGVTFGDRAFYNPDQIKTMIANNKVVLHLAIWKGKVVGMGGLLKISDHLYEECLLMVSPAYRQSNINLKVISSIILDFEKNISDAVRYSDCVTSHIRSQAIHRHYIGTCISLSAYEAPQYAGLEGIEQQRESLVFLIAGLANPYHWHLYAPSEHIDLLTGIITDIGGTSDVTPYSGDCTAGIDSVISSRSEFEGDPKTKYLLLETCGENLIQRLRQLTRDFVKEGVLAVNLAINLGKPMPADITDSLHKAGYFFTGFMPSSDHGWEMIYEYMTPQAFNFSNVHLLHQRSKDLMDYILRDKEIAENTMI